ncbi:BVRF2 [Macacine gammaherpesvirus 4]|uniref:Capsid scaffolding protein n=1 Tax=Macacine gammaherpesvirus 4 TaxID=45455 RepID=Q8UZE3_9GAMA|nr:BVRF2 [Macacine gammaherpesvirus 4]AAK95468.1 BVRF2 [Macacine gammaherpesvirus 4]
MVQASEESRPPSAAVYVCGFVERPDAPPEDTCLQLDPLVVKGQLPLKKPLPLTVEHLPDAPVGSVWGLYQSRAGLFSAASITSKDFLSLLDSIYRDCDIAQSQRTPLPRDPKVEALHAWLPSLSLASLHPEAPRAAADGGEMPFFDHVSLCALGRRRGTTAVYGTDLGWVLRHFSDLEPSIAARIADEAPAPSPDREPGLQERPLPLTKLMAKAIDAGFLRNRVETLRRDRGVANIPAESYLKASNVPDIQRTKDSAPQSPPPVSRNRATMLSGNAGEAAAACGGSAAQGQDLISVPRTTFMTLLQTNLDSKPPRQSPLPFAAPLPPFTHQAIAAPAYGAAAAPGGYFAPAGGYYAPGGDQGAFSAADPHAYHHGYPPPAYFGLPGLFGPPPPAPPYYGSHPRSDYIPGPSRANKRKREPEEDEEGGGLFPGEDAALYRKDIAGLSKSVSELQHALQALRRETLSYGHAGVGYGPQQAPCYAHTGHYGPQQPQPLLPQPCHQGQEAPRYFPHPPPSFPAPQAAQPQPPPPGTQPPPAHCAAEAAGPSTAAVPEAGSSGPKPDSKPQPPAETHQREKKLVQASASGAALQAQEPAASKAKAVSAHLKSIFCEELLNKRVA